MRKAFADAVLENLRFGLPVIQWRDGKVVEVPAEQLAPLACRIQAVQTVRKFLDSILQLTNHTP